MKRVTTFLLTPILALSLVGCAAKGASTKLPAGAISVTDAQTYRVLNDAHAFLASIRASVVAGQLTLNATQKKAFNDLVISSNAADAAWQVCHTGVCSAVQTQALQASANTLNASLAAAQAQIVTVP